jgi:transposase
VTILQIAKRLGMSRTTVRRYLHAGVFPERTQRRRAPSILDPYLGYLQQRWAADCHNASQLWREIQARGFPGTRKQVERWAQHQRGEPAPSTPHRYRHERRNRQTSLSSAVATPRQLAWLLVRNPATLAPCELRTLACIQQDRDVTVSYDLAQQFLTMVRQRMPAAFEPWLAACAASNVVELQTFATGLRQDHAAVAAALSEPWSTGPVEGHINRLKLVKRQMFGRANFDLLKQRVLHAA